MSFHDLQLEIPLVLLGLVVLVLEAIRPVKNVRGLGLALAGLVGVLFFRSLSIQPAAPALAGMYHLDAFAIFLQRLFLAIAALVLLCGAEFAKRSSAGAAEFYVITLFVTVGALFTAAVNDFILLFVALELVTVGLYVLVSYLRHDGFAIEAGMKYLLFGALASGVLVYGIAYVFGTSGSTRFDAVAAALRAPRGAGVAMNFGMLLVIAGLCFKIAAVPAQMWAPDVYQGAPTPVTALLATASKAAGFALLMRALFTCFLPARPVWGMLLVALAALSLLWGNFGAMGQTNLKRLFGYSSIAHAGYLLIGLAAVSSVGAAAVLFYLTQYAFTNLCAFLVIIALANAGGAGDIESLNSLHRRSPLLALGLALPMLSLAGVPPTSGFFGKFMLFYAAIENGIHNPLLIALVAIACVGVVISLSYYFKVIKAAYFEDEPGARPLEISAALRTGVVLCLAAIIVFGLYPAPLWDAAQAAAASLGLP